MSIKNYNIKIDEKDDMMIKYLRKECCINISQFIKKNLRDKYEEMKNAEKRKKKN